MHILFGLELLFLKLLRKIYNYLSCNKQKPQLLIQPREILNNLIYEAIKNSQPFMVARYGYNELFAGLYNYILSLPLLSRYSLYIQNKTRFIHYEKNEAQKLLLPLCNNAGFFPNEIALLPKYSILLRDDTRELDCCCIWLNDAEMLLSSEFNNNIKFSRMEWLEPYDYLHPWSSALKSKKVLVIHPFQKSIISQYEKRKLIWGNKDVLPDFELKTIKAVQSIAGNKVPFVNWFQVLDYMKSQMDSLEYDVAIIGCGAYGFHLAAHAKQTGHVAIHLGGATQILFGIKGKRWDELPAVSKFYNEHWIYPLPEETPTNKVSVENGCYW